MRINRYERSASAKAGLCADSGEGEERGTLTPNVQEKFATYTRDSATGLDYAMHRYCSNTQARFVSPDPYRASAGKGNPRSRNRYAYVENDPVESLLRPGPLRSSNLARPRGSPWTRFSRKVISLIEPRPN